MGNIQKENEKYYNENNYVDWLQKMKKYQSACGRMSLTVMKHEVSGNMLGDHETHKIAFNHGIGGFEVSETKAGFEIKIIGHIEFEEFMEFIKGVHSIPQKQGSSD